MSLECSLRLDRDGFRLAADFDAPDSGVAAVFGPTGCGKTTLLRCLAGLERDAVGTVRVRGEVWQDATRRVPPHRRALGYVFQSSALFPHLDVRGNVEYGLRRVPAAERRIAPGPVLALLELEPLLSRRVDGLSGGERQRVAIARAVLSSPRLLVMDEPLASLDRASRRRILSYLADLTATLELPLLYVSHALDEVARLADTLLLMDGGRITAQGPIAEVLTRLDLPLARDEQAEALVVGRVAGFEPAHHLMRVAFAGGEFLVPTRATERGREVRLRILARDVSLTLARQTGTSILNILPARVLAVADAGPAQCVVRLDVGGAPLLAGVTRRSFELLGLRPGAAVFAQVKTVAVLD